VDTNQPAALVASDVMPLLLEACPSFVPTWLHEVLEENLNTGAEGGRLFFVDAGAFTRHLVSLKLEGQDSEFSAVFDVIERLVLEGDGYVRNLAEIGYLEGLQTMTVTEAGLSPERDFRPYLRPASDRLWKALNRSWGGPASPAT
jgi:hypothetical protein